MMPTFDRRLMSALGSSYLDLEANRNGCLTQEQRSKFYRKRWQGLGQHVFGAGASACFCIFLAVFLIGYLQKPLVEIGNVLGVLGILLVFAVFAVTLVYLIIDKLRRVKADLDTGDVCAASGRVSLDIQEVGEHNVKYTLKISGQTFEVSKHVILAFHDGEPYHVYYLPNTKRILSAEPVEAQKEKPKR